MRTILAVPLVLLVAACRTEPPSPAGVLDRFIAATMNGDGDEARSWLVPAERDNPAFTFKDSSTSASYRVGKVEYRGAEAHVPLHVDCSPVVQTFVLQREGGRWRVSLKATMALMFQITQDELEEKLGEHLRAAPTGR